MQLLRESVLVPREPVESPPAVDGLHRMAAAGRGLARGPARDRVHGLVEGVDLVRVRVRVRVRFRVRVRVRVSGERYRQWTCAMYRSTVRIRGRVEVRGRVGLGLGVGVGGRARVRIRVSLRPGINLHKSFRQWACAMYR